MKCLWLDQSGVKLRTEMAPPDPAEGEVTVRVLYAGICSTDAALIDGMYDFTGVPGHEFVGVAVSGPDEIRNRRVVGEINIACGACAACEAGNRKHCERRKALGIRNHHGAFAEYLTLPRENLHLVPNGVSDEAATFTEPLAAALDVTDQVEFQPGLRALVVGDGKLGQLVCRVVALTGASVDVVGRYSDKIRRLEGIVEYAYRDDSITPRHYDVAVECSGSPTGLSTALAALRPKGILVLKSTIKEKLQLDASRIVVDELRLLGSRCGPFDRALSLLDRGKVDPLPLIDGRFALDDAVEGIARSRTPGVLKVILECG